MSEKLVAIHVLRTFPPKHFHLLKMHVDKSFSCSVRSLLSDILTISVLNRVYGCSLHNSQTALIVIW